VGEAEADWFERCRAHEDVILNDVRACLEAGDSAAVERFTVGAGTAGLTRTAYYAGWRVVGALTAAGWSLAELSSVPEAEVPALVASGLDLLAA
jgi:hypothetical protein